MHLKTLSRHLQDIRINVFIHSITTEIVAKNKIQ